MILTTKIRTALIVLGSVVLLIGCPAKSAMNFSESRAKSKSSPELGLVPPSNSILEDPAKPSAPLVPPSNSILEDPAKIPKPSAPLLSMGELNKDFEVVSQLQRVTFNQRNTLGQNNPIPAIQFLVQARNYVTPYGYFAYCYDRDGIEVGFVPVVLDPAVGSYQANDRVRVTILIGLLLDPNAQVEKIIIRSW